MTHEVHGIAWKGRLYIFDDVEVEVCQECDERTINIP